MLLYVILFLGTWKGVFGEDDMCDKDLYKVCVLPDDWAFPATEADMDRMCPQFMQDIDCRVDYTNKCLSKDDTRQKFRQNLRALAEEACRKDSQLHSRIVKNIGCFHETIQNDLQTCREYVREKRKALSRYIIAFEEGSGEDEDTEELWEPYNCLVNSLETVCLATKSSARCGPVTKDLVLELVGRTRFIEQFCDPENEEQLAEYITLLEFELEEETTLNRILGKE